MIKSLIRALRAISSSLILIGLMVYVWAIMCHMLMKDEVDLRKDLSFNVGLSGGITMFTASAKA